MDLIPPYSYLDTGYPGGGGSLYPDPPETDHQARRQRVVSGDRDRMVILPRRPSETESPDYVMPPGPPGPPREHWRAGVPPHYPPDYAMPGE